MLLSKNAGSTVPTTTTTATSTALAPAPTQSVPSFDMIKSAFTTTPPLTHSQATALSSSTSSKSTPPSVSPFMSSWFGSSRAFAPSPEEREKLKRALGGSNNTSLDQLTQLSSLSDVGSLPASPKPAPGFVNHGHGHAHGHHTPVHANTLNGASPSLWGSDGYSHKPRLTFSPFADDDEPSPSCIEASPSDPIEDPADGAGDASRFRFLDRATGMLNFSREENERIKEEGRTREGRTRAGAYTGDDCIFRVQGSSNILAVFCRYQNCM